MRSETSTTPSGYGDDREVLSGLLRMDRRAATGCFGRLISLQRDESLPGSVHRGISPIGSAGFGEDITDMVDHGAWTNE